MVDDENTSFISRSSFSNGALMMTRTRKMRRGKMRRRRRMVTKMPFS
jgi:hypothetical protein